MRRGNLYVGSIFLSAALAVPIGVQVASALQDDEHERHEQAEQQRKVYDEERHENRVWDRNEDAAYRHYLETKHHAYVDYDKVDVKMKRDYWKWRHEHEDHDHQ